MKPPAPRGMKHCSTCAQTLPLSAFGKDRGERDGLDYKCSACRSAHKRELYQRRKAAGLIAPKTKEYTEGPYRPTLLEAERMEESMRLFGALQNFGFITRTGQLRPIVKVELEAA